jgi:hypothetical protein
MYACKSLQQQQAPFYCKAQRTHMSVIVHMMLCFAAVLAANASQPIACLLCLMHCLAAKG